MVEGEKVREGNFYRERQFNPNQCQKGTYRNIPLGKGQRGVICKRKGMKTTSLQSKLTPVRAHRRRNGQSVRPHMARRKVRR